MGVSQPEGDRALITALATLGIIGVGASELVAYPYAKWLFLFGAVAVLYSTYLIANAGNARMVADFSGVIGLSTSQAGSAARGRLIMKISAILPLACVVAYLVFPQPVVLIAIAGMSQALMLPILGLSAIYFRDRETDSRLRPGLLWNIALTLSCLMLLITGLWGVWTALSRLLG